MTFYHIINARKYSKPYFHLRHIVCQFLLSQYKCASFWVMKKSGLKSIFLILIHLKDVSENRKHIAKWTWWGFQPLVASSMLNKLKYYPVWLSVSNTNVCPVESNKCIPSGFVLTFMLHYIFWVLSVIPCYAILLTYSYIINDSRQHTCLAVTQVPRVLWQWNMYFSSLFGFNWPITVTACA